jgi:hypothetical protein
MSPTRLLGLVREGTIHALQRDKGRSGSPVYLLVDDLIEYFGTGTEVRRDPDAATEHWCPATATAAVLAPAPAPPALNSAPTRRRPRRR